MKVIERLARVLDPDAWEFWDAVSATSPPGTAENVKSAGEQIDASEAKVRALLRELREPNRTLCEMWDKEFDGDDAIGSWRFAFERILGGEA